MVPVFGHDRVVHRHQLGAIRERALDLHFVHELGHAVHDVGPAEQLPAEVHELGHRSAVADEFENLRGDERHGFRVVQPHAPRQTLLREHASLMQRELVEFVRC